MIKLSDLEQKNKLLKAQQNVGTHANYLMDVLKPTIERGDWDELENGTRREGAFGAFYGWTMKLGFAVCFFLAGFILEWTGFDATLGGNQSPVTLQSMLWLYALLPAIGLVIAMVFVSRYPITEKVAREVRAKLNQRKNNNS